MDDLAKPDRTILEALIDANGLKPVARALLAIAEERFPLIGPDPIVAPLRPGDPGYVWPFRPGYVGNADGDICKAEPYGFEDKLPRGEIWVAADGVKEAERFGWERTRDHPDGSMVMMRR